MRKCRARRTQRNVSRIIQNACMFSVTRSMFSTMKRFWRVGGQRAANQRQRWLIAGRHASHTAGGGGQPPADCHNAAPTCARNERMVAAPPRTSVKWLTTGDRVVASMRCMLSAVLL